MLKNIQNLARANGRLNFMKISCFLSQKQGPAKDVGKLSMENVDKKVVKGSPHRVDENFECVYTFRYINHLRLLSRAKIIQTGASTVFALASIVLYQFEVITDALVLLGVNATMLFALVMLLIISRQTVKVVGRLYLHKHADQVLISHLNFFGKRRDFTLDLNEIRPITTTAELRDTFFKLQINSMDGHMLIILPLGKIHNVEKFLKAIKAK